MGVLCNVHVQMMDRLVRQLAEEKDGLILSFITFDTFIFSKSFKENSN